MLTLQDLIAYQVGRVPRHADRRGASTGAHLATAVGRVDGIVVISGGDPPAVVNEALPVGPDRTFVVPNGTDHLGRRPARGATVPSSPAGLRRRRRSCSCSARTTGTRTATWRSAPGGRCAPIARSSALVLVGAGVPSGSTRVAEARALGAVDGGVHVLPDVTSAGRNWLLRNAAAVLYPTSAEGFGLVPFEAAHFGTPTVAVDFGPLREVNAWRAGRRRATGAPPNWRRATEALLDDAELASAQVEPTSWPTARRSPGRAPPPGWSRCTGGC